MAASENPLVWDFNRQIGSNAGVLVGGVAHYYDEEAQDIFLNSGLKTRLSTPTEGHWETSELSSPSQFINEEAYLGLVLDHPANGTLYGVAFKDSELIYLRYVYAMDISDIVSSWDWSDQIDNEISQFSCSIYNIGSDMFFGESTLFQPGSKVKIQVRLGESQPCPIGTAWIDECSFDIASQTFNLSGRNTIGYFLKDQTFDDTVNWSGLSHVLIKAILDYAKVPKYKIQTGDGTKAFEFEPSTSIEEGLGDIKSYYSVVNNLYNMIELPDGTICVGYESWLKQYQPKNFYEFDEGEDVFKRKTTKMVDSSFSKIRVTGKDADGEALTPITMAISNFDNWSLGPHRTAHLTAPDGMTQEKMQAWAELQAEVYKYIGIGEDFTGPFRPQIVVGDVASVVSDEGQTNLGIITEIKHTFSREDGFKTEFSVDSGGVATSGNNYEVYSRAAAIDGFNRKQRIIDLVRYTMQK